MVYGHVLVPLNGTESAERVLPHVEAFAKNGLAGIVTFIRVVEATYVPPVFTAPTITNIFTNEKVWTATAKYNLSKAIDYLKRLVSSLNYGETIVRWEVLPTGGVTDRIVQYVVNNRVDLIIMTTRARSGISRWIFGNKVERVIRSVDIPVMVIRIPEALA